MRISQALRGTGERGLVHEGAHELAVFGLKHEPKLGKPGDGGRWHVWTCVRSLWPKAGSSWRE